MNERNAAVEGKDQRQGKQHSTFIEGDAHAPAASGGFQGSPGRSREDEDLISIGSQTDSSDKDLQELQQEEISGTNSDNLKSANYSDTDEDENEGLGDGKLGRGRPGGFE